MKNHFKLLLSATALLSLGLGSCTKDDEAVPGIDVGSPGNNAYVLNEGNYGKGNAAVSLFNKTTKALNDDIFKAVNKADLGDVVQSMTIVDNKGYIVVNNSNKIEVVSLPDFKSLTTVRGLTQPRYLLALGTAGKAYATEWRGGPYPAPYLAGRLTLLNLATNAVGSSTPVGINPGQPVAFSSNLYVPNNGDSTVSVLSEATGTLLRTVVVGAGPSTVVADRNGKIWVLCDGDFATKPSTLVRFDPATPATQTVLRFALSGGNASSLRLSPDGQLLYYSYNGAEYRMGVTDTALPTTPFIRRNLYGLNIDPRTGILYGTDARDYNSAGKLLRYQANGTVIDSTVVKISPNGVVFY